MHTRVLEYLRGGRDFVAFDVGWFEYCAGDATPMDELVVRLELPPATDEAGGATSVS